MKKIESLTEYQSYLLAMLFFVDKLCRENGIRYTVIDGTLLGAVRHQGFIPWDGDADIAITHKEFEKLKEAFSQYSGRYYLKYFPNHYYTKKRMKNAFGTITAKVIDTKCDNEIMGIDVFTIDFLGNDKEYAEETIQLYKKIAKKQGAAIAFHLPQISKQKHFCRNAVYVGMRLFYPVIKLASIIYTPFFVRTFQRFWDERISFNEQSKYYSIEPYLGRIGVEENTILREGYIDMEFDTITVMAVKNYDAYLLPTYGDYMQLPPKEKRVPYPSLDALMDCSIEIDDELRNYLQKCKIHKSEQIQHM